MTIYTAGRGRPAGLAQARPGGAVDVGVMLGASLTTYFLKGVLQRRRPVWPDPVTTLSSFSFPSGHATGIAAAAGVMIVLTLMLVRRRGQRRRAGRDRARRWRCWSGSTGSSSGVHNPSDVVAGFAVGAFWVLAGERGLPPVPPAPPPGSVQHPAADLQAARRGAQPDQGGGRRPPSGRWSSSARAAAGLGRAGVVHHDRRGPGPLDGRGRRDLRRRDGAGVRRRRHRAHRLRRARRHRRLGRHRARPAPATCWPATSASRCSCRPRSRSRCTARTGRSTWSRSPATASATTSTSW